MPLQAEKTVPPSATSGGPRYPAAHPAIEPMLQVQAFYRAVNALSLRRGFGPDRPPLLVKVTETV